VTTAWLLVGAALLLSGSRPARRPRRLSPRSLAVIAGVAVAAASVALLGPVPGAVAGVLAAPVTISAVRRLPARKPTPARSLPLTLDLAAAALRAGQPLDRALLLAAPAAGELGATFARVAGLLALGADPATAWAAAADVPALAEVAAAARRSAHSGVRLASAMSALATDLRDRARLAGQARAHRVGVFAAAPLGLCFLPSFVCLGIMPALIGLAETALR
jgi:Flp pilus assembly protein TadB